MDSRLDTLKLFDILVPLVRRILEQQEKDRKVTELKCEIADLVLDRLNVSDLTIDNRESVLTDVKRLLNINDQKIDNIPDLHAILAPIIANITLK